GKQRRAVGRGEEMRLPVGFWSRPFEEPARRDDTAAAFEGVAEHRFVGDGFHTRVEGGGQFLERFLPPRRNKAPPHRHQLALRDEDGDQRIQPRRGVYSCLEAGGGFFECRGDLFSDKRLNLTGSSPPESYR